MQINTNQILSMTEANQNFSRAVKIADQNGSAVIFRNNKPQYMIVALQDNPLLDLTDDEKIDVVAKRILNKYHAAFEELAKGSRETDRSAGNRRRLRNNTRALRRVLLRVLCNAVCGLARIAQCGAVLQRYRQARRICAELLYRKRIACGQYSVFRV